MSNALALITEDIYNTKDAFSNVLTDKSISFEREAGFAIQLLSSNDYALNTAVKDRQSVVDAVTNIAAIGISLNPAKKQAYLVPRADKICLDISYMGLLDLAIASGSVMWGQAELVYSNDSFSLNGFDKAPDHGRNPFDSARGDLVGVYVVVKTHTNDYLTSTMTIAEVRAIKSRSESAKKGKGPWETDFNEMAKKTVIKRAYKLWPKTERLAQAIHLMNTDNGEGIDFEAQDRGADWLNVEPIIAEALRTANDADALAFWKANNARFAKQPDDHRKLKDAISKHRASMQKKIDDVRTVEMPVAEKPESTPVDTSFVDAMDAASSYVPE